MKKLYYLLFICIAQMSTQPAHSMFTRGVRNVKPSVGMIIKTPRSYLQKQLNTTLSYSWISDKVSSVKQQLLFFWNNTFSPATSHIRRLQLTLKGPEFLETVFDLNSVYAQTPSYRHLEKYYDYLHPSLLVSIVKDPYCKHMVHNVLDKEKELMGEYHVFYHARRWQYGFLSDIYGMLYSYNSDEELNDFIFTHLDNPALGTIREDEHTERRERLLREGNRYNTQTHPIGIVNRQSLLFLNKFLFGNATNPSSNSMDYFINNHNMGNIDFSVREIFGMFECIDIYQQYEIELLSLQDEYNALSQYGELLQIFIPKDMVDKSVYYTSAGGPKNVYVMLSPNSRKPFSTNVTEILKDLGQYPQDSVEFALINTRDLFGGLNPKSGMKIFSYNAVDPEKMAAFKEKENNLFARIKESLYQKSLQEDREQLATE